MFCVQSYTNRYSNSSAQTPDIPITQSSKKTYPIHLQIQTPRMKRQDTTDMFRHTPNHLQIQTPRMKRQDTTDMFRHTPNHLQIQTPRLERQDTIDTTLLRPPPPDTMIWLGLFFVTLAGTCNSQRSCTTMF